MIICPLCGTQSDGTTGHACGMVYVTPAIRLGKEVDDLRRENAELRSKNIQLRDDIADRALRERKLRDMVEALVVAFEKLEKTK